jgi:hypothetical protein
MLGVTGFGLIFTPTFYVVSRSVGEWFARLRGGRPAVGAGDTDPLTIPAE